MNELWLYRVRITSLALVVFSAVYAVTILVPWHFGVRWEVIVHGRVGFSFFAALVYSGYLAAPAALVLGMIGLPRSGRRRVFAIVSTTLGVALTACFVAFVVGWW
jgi:hypothetical protein